MKNLEIGTGEDINSAARRMCDFARETGESVKSSFNGIVLLAEPKTSTSTIISWFHYMNAKRRKIIESHPKWVKAQELRRQAEKLEKEANLEVNDR